MKQKKTLGKRQALLAVIDLVILLVIEVFLLILHPSDSAAMPLGIVGVHALLSMACLFLWRFIGGVYQQVWRYGTAMTYLRMVLLDAAAGVTYYLIQKTFPKVDAITFLRVVSIMTMNLIATTFIRMVYEVLYTYQGDNKWVMLLKKITKPLTGFDGEAVKAEAAEKRKIRMAIVGAGRVGVGLAEDLQSSPTAAYTPVCFIDIDREKAGRAINGIPVVREEEAEETIRKLEVQEIVFALPKMELDVKKELYNKYKKLGLKVKAYDFPVAQSMEKGKRALREFDIEDLLFRKEKNFVDKKTAAYYRDRVVMITGGGGSIGSELSRQIAKMKPKQLIILDVYENCAYDLQQELRIAYGNTLNLAVEIVTITDKGELEKVFQKYHPDIILHAAAHKHVPLMETNCCEAVKNNVFGTLNLVELAEKYGVMKFTMISTDKAVNPTNVMGATKRMCEMIVLAKRNSKTNFSATRFGNVLGSNGSVIPLFRRQIANGGPVTLTDKRIIRYFMTIPEASQLVLQSSAMAKNGELYVLDMGKPIHILDLAENMIRMSGYEPYKDIDIIETGLRPGEKLYEELLIKTEELDKTSNSMIFIEREQQMDLAVIDEKLSMLQKAADSNENDACREALRAVVPTFRRPEEVNREAEKAEEMKQAED